MSKKLFTLLQTVFLLGTITSAYAGDITLDVFQNGVNVGTMTVPASQYPNVVGRVQGTGVTVRPQPRPAAQLAAQQKMAAWNQDFEQRHNAAMAQQAQIKQDFEQRHIAAQKKMEAWNQESDARHKAALAQQEQLKQNFDQRHADAQKGYDYWKATR